MGSNCSSFLKNELISKLELRFATCFAECCLKQGIMCRKILIKLNSYDIPLFQEKFMEQMKFLLDE